MKPFIVLLILMLPLSGRAQNNRFFLEAIAESYRTDDALRLKYNFGSDSSRVVQMISLNPGCNQLAKQFASPVEFLYYMDAKGWELIGLSPGKRHEEGFVNTWSDHYYFRLKN